MEFPTKIDALTTEWLEDVLRSAGVLGDGRVESFDINRLDGDQGALSQLAKLNLTYAGNEDPDAPRRIIAKFAVTDPDHRALLHQTGVYEREVGFYQMLAAEVEVPTPRSFFGGINRETGEFALLLEDLTPASNGNRAKGCSPAQAELAVKSIARFHAAWWENPKLGQMAWLRGLSIPARQQWAERYRQAWPLFFEMQQPDLPTSILEAGERIGTKMLDVFERFYDTAPQTLIHNDYQLDNFFFAGTEGGAPFAVIDWQLLARGRGTFDIGTFLGGNLAIADRRAHEMTLLRTYHAILLENGVEDYDWDQCLEDYRFAMFDGLFRMVVTLGRNDLREEQLVSHRDHIWPRYQAALVDLDVADLLPDE